MDIDKNSYDDLWKSFRLKLQTELTNDIRQNLEAEFEQKLQEHQKAVRKDLEKEYEAELNKHKKETEERLIKMKLEYNEKLKSNNTEYQKKLGKIKDNIKEINDLLTEMVEQTDLGSLEKEKKLNSENDSKEDKEELHPLLRPELRDFIGDVAQKLDPSSFLKFTRTNTKLHTLASEGALQTPLSLTLSTYEHSEENQWFDDLPVSIVPVYNKIPLGFKELAFLHKYKCFKVELKCLSLVDETNHGHLANIGEKAVELLDYLHVKKIDYCGVGAVVDVELLLKKYKIRDLTLHSPKIPPSFLYSQLMNRVGEVDLSLDDDNEETKKAILSFLQKTSVAKVCVNHILPASWVPMLVEKWLIGERNYTYVYFRVDSNCVDLLHEVLQKTNEVKLIGRDLKEMTMDEYKKIFNPLVPKNLRGKDNTMIVVRKNLEALKIVYGNVFYQWVTLHNMAFPESDEA